MIISMLNKNTTAPLWLDLELREDIDDYVTLIFALENKLNVTVVSIHNPSLNELSLLNFTLALFDCPATVVLSGEITIYDDRDIHPSLFERCKDYTKTAHTPLAEYLLAPLCDDIIFFGGGSLYTLATLLKANPESHINAYIQGGYAGEAIVGPENVLKKFKGRDKVPTWNLNLDLKSSDYVMAATNVTCHFISKNVCHDSWVHMNEVNGNDNELNKTLKAYFATNKWPNKCMHDLVAFLTIFNDDLVQFLPVSLTRTTDKRAKWYSLHDEHSNKVISTSLDSDLFTSVITNYNR